MFWSPECCIEPQFDFKCHRFQASTMCYCFSWAYSPNEAVLFAWSNGVAPKTNNEYCVSLFPVTLVYEYIAAHVNLSCCYAAISCSKWWLPSHPASVWLTWIRGCFGRQLHEEFLWVPSLLGVLYLNVVYTEFPEMVQYLPCSVKYTLNIVENLNKDVSLLFCVSLSSSCYLLITTVRIQNVWSTLPSELYAECVLQTVYMCFPQAVA